MRTHEGAVVKTILRGDGQIIKDRDKVNKELIRTLTEIQMIPERPRDLLYLPAHRDIIKRENNNQDNEKVLLHGTSQQGAEGITKASFDDRFL